MTETNIRQACQRGIESLLPVPAQYTLGVPSRRSFQQHVLAAAIPHRCGNRSWDLGNTRLRSSAEPSPSVRHSSVGRQV